ncbi:hypothetical protein Hanom_Chr01g00042461 [Helianthus anomalus]
MFFFCYLLIYLLKIARDTMGTTKEWYRGGIQGYFESFVEFRHALWEGMVNFINGKTCKESFHMSALYLKMDVI